MASKTWAGWKQGDYQIHFIHTGVGEAIFHIFPDGTTMLVDCGDHPALTRLEFAVPVVPNPGRLAGDWVARYITRVLPENNPTLNDRPLVDYFMLSHFHSDHCGTRSWQSSKRDCTPLGNCFRSGFGLAAEDLAFAKAIDRGYPDYTDPIPNSAPADEFEHMTRIYKKLQERDQLKIEKFQLGSSDQIIPLKNKIQDFKVQNIAANGKILCRDGSIHDLYAEHLKQTKGLNENGMSLGFLVTYGKFRFVSCGDYSDTPLDGKGGKLCVESELAKEMDKVNVAKINHHGHHGSPLPLVAAWAPRVWVACVWDQLHTLDVMLKRLSDCNAYPGERTIFPSVFPKERVQSAQNEDFFKDIAPETMGMGAHIVVTVPPGGLTYKVTCIKAEDESMEILGEYNYES